MTRSLLRHPSLATPVIGSVSNREEQENTKIQSVGACHRTCKNQTDTDQPQRNMPVILSHELHKRMDSTTSLGIAIGIVAATVIVVSIICTVTIPAIKRRQGRTSRSPERTDGIVLTTRRSSRSRRIYPDHPAVRPPLSSQVASQTTRFYNPRIESPFPDGSTLHLNAPTSSQTLRAQSTPTLSASAGSNGLFTPTQHSDITNDDSGSRFHTIPRITGTRNLRMHPFDLVDNKEFILAVPEPLALRPREAGRVPAKTRCLGSCDTSVASLTASPAHSDRLLHPNKLFRALQGRDIRSSFCSSTSMCVDHRQSDAVLNHLARDAIADTAEGDWEDAETTFCEDVEGHEDLGRKTQVADHSMQNSELASVHRFRTYQSLTAAESMGRSRIGTIIRPKTPVRDLRRFFDQTQTGPIQALGDSPKYGPAPTLFEHTEVASTCDSMSTPGTSPAFHPSKICLLPASLDLSQFRRAQDIVMPQAGPIDSIFSGVQYVVNLHSPATIDEDSSNSKEARGFYRAGRRLTKPAPLEIKQSSKTAAPASHHQQRSFTDFPHALFNPLVKANTMRSRARASSLYSRDTHGISIVNTPITPDFPTPASDTFSQPSVCGTPFKAPESVKARIDEWTQRIEGKTGKPLPPIKQVSPFFRASQSIVNFNKSDNDHSERQGSSISVKKASDENGFGKN